MFYEEPVSELKIGAKGYVYHKKTKQVWHRMVYEKYYGAHPTGWVVHHIDGNKLNNHPENLIALPESLHTNLHRIHRIGYLPDRRKVEEMLEGMEVTKERKDRAALRKLKEKEELSKYVRKSNSDFRTAKQRFYKEKTSFLKENYDESASSAFLEKKRAEKNPCKPN